MQDRRIRWHSTPQTPPPTKALLLVPAVVGAIAGAFAEYLLVPARGRARRAQLRDRCVAVARRPVKRAQRMTGQKASYLRGRVRGMPHRLTSSGPPADDRALADKVRSEVLGGPPFDRYAVNVDANDGVVVLRGQLEDRDVIRELVAAVGKVAGVRRVEDLLHTPHTTAPNVRGLQRMSEGCSGRGTEGGLDQRTVVG